MELWLIGIGTSVGGYFVGKGIEVLFNRYLGIGWTYRDINRTIIKAARKSRKMDVFGGSLEWADNVKVLESLRKRCEAGKQLHVLYDATPENFSLVEKRRNKLESFGIQGNHVRAFDSEFDFEGVGIDSMWWYKPRSTTTTAAGRIQDSRFRWTRDETLRRLLDKTFAEAFGPGPEAPSPQEETK